MNGLYACVASTTTDRTEHGHDRRGFRQRQRSRPVPRLRRAPDDRAGQQERPEVVRLVDDAGQQPGALLRITQRQHVAQVADRLRQIRRPEEDPGEQHDREGDADTHRDRQAAVERRLSEQTLDDQQRAVQRPPDHEGPRRAVPESAQQHDDRQVHVGADAPLAVAAERHVQIVAQPRRQRNVPAAPELGDRLRAVGRVEVLREHEAEHQAEADRHVGVAAEIEVDLERVRGDAVPRVDQTQRARFERKVGDLAARIGEQHLLRQPQREERDAARELRRRRRPPLELILDLRVADDRTRDELRVHHFEAQEIVEALDRGGMAAIDVDHIAERLQDVQADAERQRDAERHIEPGVGQPDPVDQPVVTLDAEVEVLEERQQGEIRADRDDQRGPLPSHPRCCRGRACEWDATTTPARRAR